MFYLNSYGCNLILVDILSLNPKINQFIENKQSELNLVNNRTKNLNHVPRNELITSTSRLNRSNEG